MESPAPRSTRSYDGWFGWLRYLHDWVEKQAEKSYAEYTLFALAFTESIFFPIPADVLLIALCVGRPRRGLRFAAITTIGSVIGAFGGYALGYWLWYDLTAAGVRQFSGLALFFFDVIPGFSEARFESVRSLYDQYNFWAIFTAGFTPLPYKVFTVSAGVFGIQLIPFFIASILSRAGRFFLVAGLFYFFGVAIKSFIDRYLEVLAVAFVVLLIGGFVVLRYIF